MPIRPWRHADIKFSVNHKYLHIATKILPIVTTAPKLRLVFYEDENIQSYFHLERTEGLRLIAILKVLNEIKGWISASTISKMIDARLPATLNTISKMAGAETIDLLVKEGRKIIARRPVLLVRKKEFNPDVNPRNLKYLKPAIYVKGHFRKCR